MNFKNKNYLLFFIVIILAAKILAIPLVSFKNSTVIILPCYPLL